MSSKEPQVGVGVFVLNSRGEFIIGKRKGSHGAGTWALPGGHLEFGEDFETCVERESLEETGLALKDIRFLTATNSIMTAEGKHYVTVFMTARIQGAKTEPEVLEPDKCEGWEWVSWERLRYWAQNQRVGGQDSDTRVLFQPLLLLLEQRPGVTPT